MKRAIFAALLALITMNAATAQEQKKPQERKRFSHEEFQERQRKYITEKAQLTAEEAEAFFPLFFELQKKKFEIERNVRKGIKRERGEKMTEEQCREFVYRMADSKIEIAKLEREYTDKYLKAVSPCKLQRIQHAEHSFQRDLMEKMTRNRNNKAPECQPKKN
ncbi:MAG: hypothetical protein IJY44_02610 [Bacteroidaceae bacterium]|nr:hypothetical protein [Bacteroidaceae bacterium]